MTLAQARRRIADLVDDERVRQDALCKANGWPSCHDPETSVARSVVVLGEEFGEVCNAVLEHAPLAHLREELVQLAAVAQAMAMATL